jgi:hypothetical protein
VALEVEVAVAVPEAVCVGMTQMDASGLAVDALRPPKAQTVHTAAPAAAQEFAGQGAQFVVKLPVLIQCPSTGLLVHVAVGPA